MPLTISTGDLMRLAGDALVEAALLRQEVARLTAAQKAKDAATEPKPEQTTEPVKEDPGCVAHDAGEP